MEADHRNNATIMKDVLQLLREIMPLLESVRHSIQESTKHIPNASAQLSKVSQATETATVEILDTLDQLSNRVSKVQNEIQELQNILGKTHQDALNTLTLIKAHLIDVTLLPSIQSLEEHFHRKQFQEFLTATDAFLKETREQYTAIAMALQVQDITNQQIVGVSHIIETIYQHLATALYRFDNGLHDPHGAELEEPKEIVVDINAQYTKSPERQLSADEIVRQWQQSHPR